MQVNMLVSAFAGGLMAMIIGGISLADANTGPMTVVPKMLAVTVPIINAAIVTAVFKAGGYAAALMLVRRGIGEKVEYVGAWVARTCLKCSKRRSCGRLCRRCRFRLARRSGSTAR